MIDNTSRQENTAPNDLEPQPRWMPREVFLPAMREFSLKQKEKYVAYFEKKYPQLSKDEAMLAAEALARMMLICLTANTRDELIQTKLSTSIQDVNVHAVTEPVVSLDGEIVEHIQEVPDDRLSDLVHKGATIFFNTNSIVRAVLDQSGENLSSFFLPHEKTAVEEVAHVLFLEWCSKDPQRWLHLLQELKALNQKTSFTEPKYIEDENFPDYYDSAMEKHGRDWVTSYEAHFYPVSP